MTGNRMQRGLENLRRIDGEAGQKVIDGLADVSPDLARYTIEYPFADIYARPGLPLREREIATIAALTALGNAGFPAALNGMQAAKEVFQSAADTPS